MNPTVTFFGTIPSFHLWPPPLTFHYLTAHQEQPVSDATVAVAQRPGVHSSEQNPMNNQRYSQVFTLSSQAKPIHSPSVAFDLHQVG
jgi:hypothetical protein